MIFILEKKTLGTNYWCIKGYYSTYKKAQDNFIFKDGIFRIREEEVDKND